MWILWIAMGCSEPEEDLMPPGPPPEERAVSITEDLQAAHQAWLAEDREQAHVFAQRAYVDHFEPMEPLLRDHDALQTLKLEYLFGQLMAAVEVEEGHVEVFRTVDTIQKGVAGLVAVVAPSAASPE